MRMFKKDEGFTLVELMVVVLIIGILVAVAIPVFNSASAAARKRACQANLRTLDGAVEQWASANPLNKKSDITSLATAATKLNVADDGTGSTGIYVKSWDKSTSCPGGGGPTGAPYDVVYTVTPNDVAFLCDFPATSPGGPHVYP